MSFWEMVKLNFKSCSIIIIVIFIISVLCEIIEQIGKYIEKSKEK